MRFVDYDGNNRKDKVIGFAIGVVTNIVPLSTGLRDRYSPTDPSDYNGALRAVDETSFAVGMALTTEGGSLAAAGVGTMLIGGTTIVASGGTAAVEGGAVAVAGAEAFTIGAKSAMVGAMLMGNSAANKSAGYERGKETKLSDSKNTESSGAKRIQRDVEKGRSPNTIDRVDPPHNEKGKPHVHFKDNSAVNIDGTFKEGSHKLTHKEKKFFEKYGWYFKKEN